MADYEVARARGGEGPGRRTLHAEVVEVDDGDTYDTGLSTVDVYAVTGTSASVVANVTNNSDGVLTLSVEDNGGTAQNGEDVHVFALGQR